MSAKRQKDDRQKQGEPAQPPVPTAPAGAGTRDGAPAQPPAPSREKLQQLRRRLQAKYR
jgi:hypothetical protein